MSRYEITGTASDNNLRLASAVRLTPADFDMIALEAKARPFRARKVGFVSARQATAEVPVETHWNGKESHDVARVGDWIATNMSKDRAILRDGKGLANTYVIRAADFGRLYDAAPDGTTDFGAIYKSKSTVEAIELAGGFDIIAPWGEAQRGDSGYLLKNGNDVYGNNKATFEATYEILG